VIISAHTGSEWGLAMYSIKDKKAEQIEENIITIELWKQGVNLWRNGYCL
jgi:hypothetical protein